MTYQLGGCRARNLVEFPLTFGVGLIALAMSFSVIESVKFVAIFALFVWSGRSIVRLLVPTSLGPNLELALGILLASLFAVILFQTARVTEFPIPLTVGGLTVIGVLGSLRRGSSAGQLDVEKQFEIVTILMLFRGLQGATWLLGGSLVFFVLRKVLRRDCVAPRTRFVLLLGAGLVFAASLSLRHIQFWWWYPSSNDAQFFESMSHSLSNFGPFEHPGVLGKSLMGYHWFVYGWTGVISELVGAENWHSLVIYIPLLSAVVAVLLVHAITDQLKGADHKWIRYPLTASVLLAAPTFALSNWFGNLWILAILAVLLAPTRNEVSSSALLIFLLGSGAVFAKGTNVVLLAVIVSTVFLVRGKFSQQYTKNANLVALIAASVVGIIYYATGIGSRFVSTNRTTCGFDQFFSCTRESLNERIWPFLFAVFLLVIAQTRKEILRSSPKLAAGRIFAILLLIAIVIFPASGDFVTYIINSLGFVVYVILVGLISRVIQDDSDNKRVISGVKVLAGSAALVGTIGSILEFAFSAGAVRGSPASDFFGSLGRLGVDIYLATWKWIVALLVVLAFPISAKWLVLSPRASRVALGVFTVVSFAVGLSVGESAGRYWIGSESFTKSSDNSAPMADDGLVSLGHFVSKTTPISYVLATNNFCCSGSSWLKYEVDEVLADGARLNTTWATKFGGANYLVAAETQRRTLVSGLRFVVSSLITKDIVQKLKMSVEFANSPSLEKMKDLCDLGADGAVINLRLTARDSWNGPGVVKFISGDFVFVDFNQCRE
jgi:hypothetical protein